MRKRLHLIFPMITYGLGILLLILGLNVMEYVSVSDIACAILIPLTGFIFPLIVYLRKKEIPLSLNIVVCVYILLSIFGGGVFNLYSKIWFYDLFLHGLFGFIGSLFIYYILIQSHGQKIFFPVFLGIIFFSTLGIGGLWEIWEYCSDVLTGGDAQRVKEAMELGLYPVADTMEDLMITMAGIALFYLVLWLDRFFNHRILKPFDKDRKEELD